MSEIDEFIKNRLSENLKAHKILEAEAGEFSKFPKNLREDLKKTLFDSGIKNLYHHQALAFESISKFEDTLVISKTASGKTLSFLLPILNDYFNSEKKFTTLLMYPTKALSRDQEGTLGKLMKSLSSASKFGTFDGDTPKEIRERLKTNGEFIISNPDMLHSGILPNHNRKWKKFLSRLKYIVIDEVHMYRGSFGSHVANVFSRLIRVCRFHGANPIFICSSATVGNPSEHVEALFKRSFTIIDKDSSPRPQREIFFMTPKLVLKEDGTEYRKAAASISLPLIQYAAHNKIRTICFCRARGEVEKLYSTIIDMEPSLIHKIRLYRGGLLPNERRQIESDLFSGKISVIISTNALELGIDIGDLELCILNGFPGSFASFWQQAGRVGRKGKNASIVFIAKDNPIDQYLVNHPEFIIQTPIEEAWLSSYNPYILLQHLPCAAYENPLKQVEEMYNHPIYDSALNVLVSNNTLKQYKEVYRYGLTNYPALGVSLRGIADSNILISENDSIIGEMDILSARTQIYKDAIYQHMGRKYISLELNLETKISTVQRIETDYYTEAVSEVMVGMTEVDEEKIIFDSILKYGEVNINRQPKLYKKIKERTGENVGNGTITLPPFIYDTTGISLTISEIWLKQILKIDSRFSEAALFGLSYILRRVAPSLCMADANDIHTDVALTEITEASFRSGLYLYDAMEGGVGYSEKIFEKFDEAIKLCLTIIQDCDCTSGCPACVTPQPDGIEDDEINNLFIESNASVECTKSLLIYLNDGSFYAPIIKKIEHQKRLRKEVPEKNPESEKMEKRLFRAANIMTKKRERAY